MQTVYAIQNDATTQGNERIMAAKIDESRNGKNIYVSITAEYAKEIWASERVLFESMDEMLQYADEGDAEDFAYETASGRYITDPCFVKETK